MNIAVLDSLCINMSWVNSEQAMKDHTKCVSAVAATGILTDIEISKCSISYS